jgi:hypothetical protein
MPAELSSTLRLGRALSAARAARRRHAVAPAAATELATVEVTEEATRFIDEVVTRAEQLAATAGTFLGDRLCHVIGGRRQVTVRTIDLHATRKADRAWRS